MSAFTVVVKVLADISSDFYQCNLNQCICFRVNSTTVSTALRKMSKASWGKQLVKVEDRSGKGQHQKEDSRKRKS